MSLKVWCVICMLTSQLSLEAQWQFLNQRQQTSYPAQYLTMNPIQGEKCIKQQTSITANAIWQLFNDHAAALEVI